MYSGVYDQALEDSQALRLYFYGELIMSSLGLALVLVSLIKMSRQDLQGYRILFWGSALFGYTTMFVYGITGTTASRTFRLYFLTFGVITIEFCFSIVNLALSSTHAILRMCSPSTEWLWLLYSVSHIPVALMLAALYDHYHAPGQNMFWNHVWLFVMQLTNLAAFMFHVRCIRRSVCDMTISRKTAVILVALLSRFMEFCVCYTIYMLSTFILMVLALVDIGGGWSSNASYTRDCALYLYGSARFYTFLRAVYIFRPYWTRKLTSATLDVFHSATVRTGNIGSITPASSTMINAGSPLSRRNSTISSNNAGGLTSYSLTVRLGDEDLKHIADGTDESLLPPSYSPPRLNGGPISV